MHIYIYYIIYIYTHKYIDTHDMSGYFTYSHYTQVCAADNFFLYRFGWGDMLATSRNATKMVLDPLVDHFEPCPHYFSNTVVFSCDFRLAIPGSGCHSYHHSSSASPSSGHGLRLLAGRRFSEMRRALEIAIFLKARVAHA